MASANEIVLYQPDETVKLEVRLENDTVWLTQQQMAELFGTQRQAITKETLDFLRTNVIKKQIVKLRDKAEARTFYNYPYQALEEAVVDSLYHRDWTIPEPVEITIEPDARSFFLIDIPCHPGFIADNFATDSIGVKNGVKELSDIQKVIIDEIQITPNITTSELAQKLDIRFRTLQRYISQLQAMGIVAREGGRKVGRWLIIKNYQV